MRRRLPLILLPVLSLLAACADNDAPRIRSNEVLLQVSATGRGEVRPDEARITVGVSSTEATAQAASEANTAAMNRVVAALAAAGVRPDDVQTRNLTLGRIDYGPQRGRYRAENLVDIRLKDVAKAGMAVAAATDAGGNVVSGPDLRVTDPDAADNAAYAAAYKAAQTRAQAYAKAAGMKVARVLAIRDGGVAAQPYRYRDGVMLEQASAVGSVASGPPVSPGLDRREVRVEVDFALRR